jgi:hypothetical protein
MSLEIKINDSFVPFEFAPKSAKIDLEWALVNNAEMQMNCYKCHKPIPNGIGSYCLDCKNVNLRSCPICEFGHEGLYCENCFTGEIVNYKVNNRWKRSRVIKLTPNTCNA